MNSGDVIVNGLAGAVIAFLGTIIFSLIRAPRLLDEDRGKRETETQKEIGRLSQELARTRPIDGEKEKFVRSQLAKFTPSEIDFIKWLLLQGEVPGHRYRDSAIPNNVVGDALDKARVSGLVVDDRDNITGNTKTQINPSFRQALETILHPW